MDRESWLSVHGGEYSPGECGPAQLASIAQHVAEHLRGLAQYVRTAYSVDVESVLTRSHRLAARIERLDNENQFLCLLPVGFVFRTYYMIQLLDSYRGRTPIHITDVDFYGDCPEPILIKRRQRPFPFPMDTLFAPTRSFDELNVALAKVGIYLVAKNELRSSAIDQEDQVKQREIQKDQLLHCCLFVAFHELAHVVRNHFVIQTKIDSSRKVAIQRKMEVDADWVGGRLLGRLSSCNVVSSYQSSEQQLSAISLVTQRCVYAIAFFFGIIRISDYAVEHFNEGDYHHPTARMQIAINGLFSGIAECFSRQFIQMSLVPIADEVLSQYAAAVNHFWKEGGIDQTRRPSSLYIPLALSGRESENVPFGKLAPGFPSADHLMNEARESLQEFHEEFRDVLGTP